MPTAAIPSAAAPYQAAIPAVANLSSARKIAGKELEDCADAVQVPQYPSLAGGTLNNQTVRQSIKNVADNVHRKQGWARHAMPIGLFIGGLGATALSLAACFVPSVVTALGGNMAGVAALAGAIVIAALLVAAIVRVVRLVQVARDPGVREDRIRLEHLLGDIDQNLQAPDNKAEAALRQEAAGAMRLTRGDFFGERGALRACLLGATAALLDGNLVFGYLFGKARAETGYPTRFVGDGAPARVDALRSENAYTLTEY